MNRRNLNLHTALAAATVCLAACSSPSPTFYALRADEASAATSTAMPAVPTGAAALDVVVGPVTVPDMVDRPQIVTRNPDNTIAMNEFARWASPLKLDVGRVVAADLEKRLGAARVSTIDAGAAIAPVWRVRVDITRIDSVLGDSVTIDAQWVVRPPGHQALTYGHTVAHEQVTSQDYGALVDAHDRALATISADIAAAIRADHETVGSAKD